MGISLAALLVMSVFFTGVLMMYRTTLFGNVVVSNAVDASVEQALKKSKTYIVIDDVAANSIEVCKIQVGVQNRGAIATHDFDSMDVIVHYQGATAPVRLQYSSGNQNSLTGDDWTMTIDATKFPFEPSIFNPGEDATIHGRLNLASPDNISAIALGTASGYVLRYSTGPVGVGPC
jgi:archaellum component FlaF (FlaF/FlaG flagellin family)